VPREETIWFVGESAKNKIAGRKNKISILELKLLCSLGKSNAKHRKPAGIPADAAKPILDQNRILGSPCKK
jgi:hypothetical protein